jgi:hypothetical protein
VALAPEPTPRRGGGPTRSARPFRLCRVARDFAGRLGCRQAI